ncbi:MAG: hypothetical protein EZS28_028207, partial [Streblomastix strix]
MSQQSLQKDTNKKKNETSQKGELKGQEKEKENLKDKLREKKKEKDKDKEKEEDKDLDKKRDKKKEKDKNKERKKDKVKENETQLSQSQRHHHHHHHHNKDKDKDKESIKSSPIEQIQQIQKKDKQFDEQESESSSFSSSFDEINKSDIDIIDQILEDEVIKDNHKDWDITKISPPITPPQQYIFISEQKQNNQLDEGNDEKFSKISVGSKRSSSSSKTSLPSPFHSSKQTDLFISSPQYRIVPTLQSYEKAIPPLFNFSEDEMKHNHAAYRAIIAKHSKKKECENGGCEGNGCNQSGCNQSGNCGKETKIMNGEYPKQQQNLELNKVDLHNAEKLRSLFGLITSLPVTEGQTILDVSEKLANLAWEERNNIEPDHIDILADIISSLLQRIRRSDRNDIKNWKRMKKSALQLGLFSLTTLDKHKVSLKLIHPISLLFPVKSNKFMSDYEQQEEATEIPQDINIMIKVPRTTDFLKGISFYIDSFAMAYNLNTFNTLIEMLGSLAIEGQRIGAEELRLTKHLLKPFVIAVRLIKQTIVKKFGANQIFPLITSILQKAQFDRIPSSSNSLEDPNTSSIRDSLLIIGMLEEIQHKIQS